MTDWTSLVPGRAIRIAKINSLGVEVANYPGVVLDLDCPSPWVVAEATWTSRFYDLNGLHFVVGDRLLEYFSPVDWFNAFAVFAPEGTFRGWYANVTKPARLEPDLNIPILYWDDLYVDVVALPDGAIVVRDEEELAESGLETTAPDLFARIQSTRNEIIRRVQSGRFPFHHPSASA